MEQPPHQPYPWARMACNMCTVLTLGSVVSYSVWGKGYLEIFPSWTEKDVTWVYSLGCFGAFSMVLGGVMYDRVGPTWTTVLGLLCIVTGFGGILHCAASSHTTSPAVIGLLYFLEEMGQTTVWTCVAVETVRYFPAHTVGLTMGVLCACWDGSGMIWAAVLSYLDMGVTQNLMLICFSMVAATLPQFLMGPMGHDRPGGRAAPALLGTYLEAFASPGFFVFVLVVVIMGPWEVVRGILKHVGVAGGIHTQGFTPAMLGCAAAGMVLFGSVNSYRRQSAFPVMYSAACLMFVGGAVLYTAFTTEMPPQFVWLGAAAYFFGAGGVKATCPAWSKETFRPEVLGGVEATRNVLLGVATVVCTVAAPESHAAAHFFRPILALGLAMSALGVACLSVMPMALQKTIAETFPLLRASPKALAVEKIGR
jgi:hypothetical protein